MTTELQQALVDDALPVVQRKVMLGSYPHAVYKKALAEKAWDCAKWLVQTYPKTLSAWDWHELASNKNLSIEPDIVRLAHANGIEKNTSRSWKNSAIAWEWAGVEFSLPFYNALWKTSGLAFKTRGQLFQLGKMHRFGPVEGWLASETAPAESEVKDVFKQLWDHALLHCDRVLLKWLNERTSRADVMNHIHNCINVRSLALPSILLRRANRIEWSIEIFLDKGLPGLNMTVDDFCQYVALYDAPRLKHVWSKMNASNAIPVAWRLFFDSGAKRPTEGNEQQGLVLVLHTLFPMDESLRMQQCSDAQSLEPAPQADLVDLL